MPAGAILTIDHRQVNITPGQPSVFSFSLNNTSDIVEDYKITFFGLDNSWVKLKPARVGLEPGEHEEITATIDVPVAYPAGKREFAMRVIAVSREVKGAPEREVAIETFELSVEEKMAARLAVTPTTIWGGSEATYSVVAQNLGNAPVSLAFASKDPEALVTSTFDPDEVRIQPTESGRTKMSVKARRPWIGAPAARVLTVSASGRVEPTQELVTFMQKPRIPTWLVSLLSVLLMLTVMLLALYVGISKLKSEEEVAVAPLYDLTGGASDAASGKPLAGVTVAVFDLKTPEAAKFFGVTSPAHTLVAEGDFELQLPAGVYKLRFTSPEFGDIWFNKSGGSATIDGATAVNVSESGGVSPVNPRVEFNNTSSICGVVRFAKEALPVSRRVTPVEVDCKEPPEKPVRQPVRAELIELALDGPDNESESSPESASTSELKPRADCPKETHPPSPGLLGDVVVSVAKAPPAGAAPGVEPVVLIADKTAVDGTFTLPELPSPGIYDVTFVTIGASSQTIKVELGNDPDRSNDVRTETTLFPGTHQITGHVLPPDPIASCQTLVRIERPATVPGVAGRVSGTVLVDGPTGAYTITGLEDGAYKITATQEGFANLAKTVELKPDAPVGDVDLVLAGEPGVIHGSIWAASPQAGEDESTSPLKNVAVSITDRDNKTMAKADASDATFRFADLPTPAVYTLTFEKEGFLPRVVTVALEPGPDSPPQKVVMWPVRSTDLAAIFGVVFNEANSPVAGAEVLVSDGENTFMVKTADDPVGAYEVTGLPPGSYTITVKKDDKTWIGRRGLAGGQRLEIKPTIDVEAPLTIEQLTLNPDGIGPLKFGDRAEDVLKALTATLGSETNDTGLIISNGSYGTCANTLMRVVHFGALVIVITVVPLEEGEEPTPDPDATTEPTAEPEPDASPTPEPTATPEATPNPPAAGSQGTEVTAPRFRDNAGSEPEKAESVEVPEGYKEIFSAYLLDERFDPDPLPGDLSRQLMTNLGIRLMDRDPRVGDEPAELVTGIYSNNPCSTSAD